MAASGSIVEKPLAAVAARNAKSLPMAEAGYVFMMQVLGDHAAPLIFPSLALSAAAVVDGLGTYESMSVTKPGRWP